MFPQTENFKETLFNKFNFVYKALVALYEEPEKPQDAAGYLKNNFAGHGSLVSELDAVKSENGQLKQRVETLEKELGAVKTENRQLKPKMDNQVRLNASVLSRGQIKKLLLKRMVILVIW